MAKGFSHPKAVVNVGDGFEYLKNHQNEFDVIITDSSDPEGNPDGRSRIIQETSTPFLSSSSSTSGPAESLFGASFYALLKSALKPPHGIICCQGKQADAL